MTIAGLGGTILENRIAKIEARDSRVPAGKDRHPPEGERGDRRSRAKVPEFGLLGRREIPDGLSQKFCEALLELMESFIGL